METSIEPTEAAGPILEVCFLLNLSQSVSVHPQLNIKTFSFVLAVLDCARHSEESVTTRLLDKT